jgi:rod shape determining protein RodA
VLNRVQDHVRKFDWVLFAAVVLLIALGVAAIYSVGLSSEEPDFSNVRKQVIFGAIGLVLLFGISLINYSAFRAYSRVFYFLAVLLLVAVLFFGTTIRGTTGWFNILGLGFQPVELAKIALIVFLARFFANRFQQFKQSKHIIVSLTGTLILVGLVVLQPDLGSATVLLGIWGMLLLLTGVRFRYIAGIAVVAIIVVMSSWAFLFQDYQKDRIMTFINPESDPLGSGYNVSQAMIAIGSGQMSGRGLGFGSQSQLKFIPESQTDFVFAVIAEELGVLGVALVLGLWLVICYRLVRIAMAAPDDFGMFLILGICIAFFIHIVINIGMNLGLMPVTGISLPFLSYGGSFLITSLIMIGMAQSVAVRRKTF